MMTNDDFQKMMEQGFQGTITEITENEFGEPTYTVRVEFIDNDGKPAVAFFQQVPEKTLSAVWKH